MNPGSAVLVAISIMRAFGIGPDPLQAAGVDYLAQWSRWSAMRNERVLRHQDVIDRREVEQWNRVVKAQRKFARIQSEEYRGR